MDRRSAIAAFAACAVAPSLARAAPSGRTFTPSLPSAPFPHASRAAGHDYDHVHYAADVAYADATVGIYVPPRFFGKQQLDMVVHFHGWNNHVSQVFDRYRLREQFDASGLNAVLVVPQGPKDAPDSGDGKLELDDGGLKRLLADVIAYLNAQGVAAGREPGKVALTSHSGGYAGAGGSLLRGGVPTITDVILFDSAYGYFDAFADWANASPERHFLSLFTADTAFGNAALMAKMQAPTPNLFVRDAAVMTLAQLQTRAPTFVATSAVAHDELLQKYDWFAMFLETTALSRV